MSMNGAPVADNDGALEDPWATLGDQPAEASVPETGSVDIELPLDAPSPQQEVGDAEFRRAVAENDALYQAPLDSRQQEVSDAEFARAKAELAVDQEAARIREQVVAALADAVPESRSEVAPETYSEALAPFSEKIEELLKEADTADAEYKAAMISEKPPVGAEEYKLRSDVAARYSRVTSGTSMIKAPKLSEIPEGQEERADLEHDIASREYDIAARKDTRLINELAKRGKLLPGLIHSSVAKDKNFMSSLASTEFGKTAFYKNLMDEYAEGGDGQETLKDTIESERAIEEELAGLRSRLGK